MPSTRNTLRYPLVCFDLDGTLIQGTVFIWKTLHEHFRTDSGQREQARQDFFGGRISYESWFEHDLRLLKERGATRGAIQEMLESRVRPTPGSHETLAVLRRAGCKLAVLSGSLDLVLTSYFPEVPFDCVFINRVRFDELGGLDGGTATLYDLEHKADGLVEICRRCGCRPEEAAFVGDNYNDLSAARVAGLSIAFNPRSDRLRALAHVVVEEPDLTAILPHLGIDGPK